MSESNWYEEKKLSELKYIAALLKDVNENTERTHERLRDIESQLKSLNRFNDSRWNARSIWGIIGTLLFWVSFGAVLFWKNAAIDFVFGIWQV